MRWLVLVLALGAAHEARAEQGLYIGGGASYLGNASIGGPALTTDLAARRGRWAFGGELSGRWLPTDGFDVRTGALVRWVARSWSPDGSAAVELYVDGSPGVQLIAANDAQLVRPDLRVGGGLQVHIDPYRIRIGVRVTLAPRIDPATAMAIACRGCEPSDVPTPVIDDGFEVLLGVAW